MTVNDRGGSRTTTTPPVVFSDPSAAQVLDEPAEHLAIEPSDGPGWVDGDPGQWRSFL